MKLVQTLENDTLNLDKSNFPALFFFTESQKIDYETTSIRRERIKLESLMYNSKNIAFTKFQKNICQY